MSDIREAKGAGVYRRVRPHYSRIARVESESTGVEAESVA